MPSLPKVNMDEILSRPGVRIKPKHVPRFSRPVCAGYTQYDGLGYQHMYMDAIERDDIRRMMGCVFMLLGYAQSDGSFTSYADLLERMLAGDTGSGMERYRENAKLLDDWRCQETALTNMPRLPNVKVIPFDFIRQYSADLKNPSSKFDDIDLDQFQDVFGELFLEIIRRKPSMAKTPHASLIECMLNGHDYKFANDLRQVASNLDNVRWLSVQASIREYWRSADESEENGGEPGTFKGMREYMSECGLVTRASGTKDALEY